jgi:Glucodextranase, domain B
MRLGPRRRDPVSRERYRALARAAGVPRRARPRWLDGVLALVLGAMALLALPRVAAAVGSGLDQLVSSVQAAVPLLQGRGSIDLPAGGSTSVGAAPVVDSLPAYTKDPQLQLTGKVPSFAVQTGRSLQIVVNGAVLSTKPLDPSGSFSAVLPLRDGPNTISVTLIGDRDIVAASAYTVVLDRTPPNVTITRPEPGSTVDAQNVVVAGTTDPGSTITVNGRLVVTAPDGTFTDSFTATPGTLQIAVVSRDRAGNETTEKLTVIAQQTTQIAGVTVTVVLDKPTVKPGQGVLATIYVVGPTGPRPGVPVTLSVGVVTIGTSVTDGTGAARIAFAAPPNEGEASVVVLAAGSSGRASLTIAAR